MMPDSSAARGGTQLKAFWGGAIVLFAFALIGLAGCGTRSHWQLNLHDRDSTLAFTIAEQGGSRSQTIIFDEVRSGVLKPRNYRLPEDLPNLQGASLEFSDITLLPGRVRFAYRGHTFDLMQSALMIDGKEYAWNATPEIHLRSPN